MTPSDKTSGTPGNDFAQEMLNQGVKPLSNKQSNKQLKPAKLAPKSTDHITYRRQQASNHGAHGSFNSSASNHTVGDSINDWLGPHDIIEFKRSGLQHGQFKDFKRGKIRPAITLDLHRCTVAESRQLIVEFVEECQQEGLRCALVMHGKGYHSRPLDSLGQTKNLYDKQAISKLKSYAVNWLKQMPEVLALSSAQPKDGGTGALYVLFSSQK